MKGIMFIEWLFEAVVSGEKTETRRVINIPKDFNLVGKGITGYTVFENNEGYCIGKYPRYFPDEVIFLKEPYYLSMYNKLWKKKT